MSSERYVISDPSHKGRFHECLFKALWFMLNARPDKRLTIAPVELAHLPAGLMITATEDPQSGALTFEASCGE